MADHQVGDTVSGRVVNVTDFGLFVDIHDGLEGLAHISEIDVEGGKLESVYRVGDWVSARILRIEEEEKKIGLTMRGVDQSGSEAVAAVAEPEPDVAVEASPAPEAEATDDEDSPMAGGEEE